MLVLDDPTTWPKELIAALADDTVTAELEKLEYVENHDPRGAVANVLSMVDDSVKSHGIAGFHCTKEPFAGFFSERGLRVLEMETHHREVLEWLESDLSPEVLARVATPFFTTRAGGTGLGLALARQWVTRHDGSLRLTSELGEGTTARVILPLGGPQADSDSD